MHSFLNWITKIYHSNSNAKFWKANLYWNLRYISRLSYLTVLMKNYWKTILFDFLNIALHEDTFVMIIAEDVGWRQHVVHALLPIGSMNSLVHHVWDRPQNCRTWAVFDKNVAGPPSSSHLCQDRIYFETGNCSVLKISKDWIFSAHKKNRTFGEASLHAYY